MNTSTLRDLAADVVRTYDFRLRDELAMLAHGQAVEALRGCLGRVHDVQATEPELMPLEVQAMAHISKVLGAVSSAAGRCRVLLVVALALAPDVFSNQQFAELMKRAKGA